jgi:hypothetical protein
VEFISIPKGESASLTAFAMAAEGLDGGLSRSAVEHCRIFSDGTVHIDAGLAPGPVPTVNGSGIKAQGISKVG